MIIFLKCKHINLAVSQPWFVQAFLSLYPVGTAENFDDMNIIIYIWKKILLILRKIKREK